MNKVAKITLGFWIMKICATTLGETGGDLLSMTLHIGYAVSSAILFSLFLVAVIAQITSKKIQPSSVLDGNPRDKYGWNDNV